MVWLEFLFSERAFQAVLLIHYSPYRKEAEMRFILCLLLMAVFTGCHSTSTQATKAPEAPEQDSVARRPDLPPPRLDAKAFMASLDPTMPEVSIQDEGDKNLPKMQYTCIATGEFNLAPTLDHLMMETWCVGDTGDGGKVVVHVDDQPAHRANSHFEIPFRNEARINITDEKKSTLELRYTDEKGNAQTMPLHRQTGTHYSFTFADLVPDEIVPDGEYRTM